MAIKEADENDELQESEEKENIPEEKPKGRKLGSPIKKKKRVSIINISVPQKWKIVHNGSFLRA